MAISWIHQEGLIFLFILVGTASGEDPSISPTSLQISVLGSQLSTLGSQLTQLQQQVDVLHQECLEDKERIVHLEEVSKEFERRVSLLELVCGSAEIETEILGEEEVNVSANVSSASSHLGSLMAIGGWNEGRLRSAEVLNTSCDFPLPEGRHGHTSVITADTKILVCGGTLPSGHTASCLEFNSHNHTWEEHSIMRSRNRTLASSIVLPSGLYVLGGADDGSRSSSEFLATGSSVWTRGPRIPGEGVFQSCAAKLSDTEFVILGGRVGRGTQARVYNELTRRWREWPRLTERVYGHSCVGLGDKVIMAGGMNSPFSFGFTGRTVIFDIKTGSAQEVASLKYPRYWAAMGLYRGKAIILGGTSSSEWRSDGEIWNMDTETWEEADTQLKIARAIRSLVTMAEEIMCD